MATLAATLLFSGFKFLPYAVIGHQRQKRLDSPTQEVLQGFLAQTLWTAKTLLSRRARVTGPSSTGQLSQETAEMLQVQPEKLDLESTLSATF